MSDVFLSYSRRDGEFTRWLLGALQARGKDVWVDVEGIAPASRWAEELQHAIEAADAFVFVISPDSVASPECARELEHAASLNKRIVPLHLKEVDPRSLASPLSTHNWVPQTGLFTDDHERSFEALMRGIETDLDWVRGHTQLGQKALEWEAHRSDPSFLLSGTELESAEQFLGAQSGKKPEPTTLQNLYVLSSRRAATARLRRTRALVSVALIVAIVLSVVAVGQWRTAVANKDEAVRNQNQAVANARTATSRRIASDAEAALTSDPQLSALLSIEALKVERTAQAETALRDATPRLQVLHILDAGEPLQTAVFSADGTRVATAGLKGTVTLHDVKDGRQLGVLKDPGGYQLLAVAFSPDGKSLVTSGADGALRLWDAASGKAGTVTQEPAGVFDSGVAFSPDGAFVATAGSDGVCRLYDAALALRGPQTPPGRQLSAVAFNHDGSALGIASQDGTALVLHANGDPPTQISTHGVAVSVAFTVAGDSVVTADGDGTARTWDASSGAQRQIFGSIGGPIIVGAAISPDGADVATAGHNGQVTVWSADSGHRLFDLAGHTGGVTSVAFSPDGGTLLTASQDGTARLWDARPREARVVVHTPGGHSLSDVAFSKDGAAVAAVGFDGVARVYVTDSGKQLQTFTDPSGLDMTAVDLSQTGGRVLTAGGDGTARIWDLASGKQISALSDPTSHLPLLDGRFSPDATQVVTTANRGGGATVWSVQTLAVLHRLVAAPGVTVFSAAYSRDATRIVAGSDDGMVRVYDSTTGKALATWTVTGKPAVITVAFSPDGTGVLAAGADGRTRVLDSISGNEQFALTHPGGAAPTGARYSEDGKLIVTSSDDGTTRVWDASTGNALTVFGEPGGAAMGRAAFSSRGSVATVDQVGTLVIWSSELAAALDVVQGIATSRLTRPLSAAERQRYLSG